MQGSEIVHPKIIEVEHPEAAPMSAGLVEVQKQKGIAEIQAAIMVARRFPRDLTRVAVKIKENCKRHGMAEQALFKFPRGEKSVEGVTIRLAEMMAQNYQNLNWGLTFLEKTEEGSLMLAYCHDLENNTRIEKIFPVSHIVATKKGPKRLTDPRDIYDHTANIGSRRVRTCILGIIPSDIVEEARKECKKTLERGDGTKSLAERIRDMASAFKEVGISQEMIEKRVGHKIDLITASEIVELQSVYNSIKDGTRRSEFFEFKEEKEAGGKAQEFQEKLKDLK